jgi:hypothetical protein
MRKLNLPCDPDHQAKVLQVFRREGIKFLRATDQEPGRYSSDPYKWAQMPVCFVLVAEKDGDRAEEVLQQFEFESEQRS